MNWDHVPIGNHYTFNVRSQPDAFSIKQHALDEECRCQKHKVNT
jgi:hypothetical protein